ncbi:transcription factor Ouib isoform X1 [Drosophila simulans]|uniref:transcription factor Ouib isoform X1 n=1 Tax=Drosophila simulans TaxID=7240 RepID=UPI00078AEE39|nr:transcription factor Ouib isoform X1 [Drosophila simulans]KMZ02928.1 uncharacterized protein Dsimw501_GD20209 [Drosophila simulans]
MTPQCRLCGDSIYTQNPFNIFDERSNMVRQIALVTGLWLTDHSKMPRNMCSCCLLSLKSAIAFRQVCINTNNRLTIQRRRLEAKDDGCWDDPLSDAHEVLKINDAEVEQEVLYEVSYADNEGLEEDHDLFKKEEEESEVDEQKEFVDTASEIPSNKEDNDQEQKQECEDMVDKRKGHDAGEESQEYEESHPDEEDEEESQEEDDELWQNEDGDSDTDIASMSDREATSRQPALEEDKKSIRKYTNRSSPKNDDTDILKPAKKKRKTYISRKVHVCDHCGKKFTDKGNFNLHVLRHSGVKPFECPECGQKEFNRYILNIHIRVKHRGEKPYACQFCDEKFVHSTMRSRHENRVHRNRKSPKNFKCNYCDKRFESNYQRAKHEVVHTGERKFHCEVCKVSFTRNSNLRTHYRSGQHQRRQIAMSAKSEKDSKNK